MNWKGWTRLVLSESYLVLLILHTNYLCGNIQIKNPIPRTFIILVQDADGCCKLTEM